MKELNQLLSQLTDSELADIDREFEASLRILRSFQSEKAKRQARRKRGLRKVSCMRGFWRN